MKTAFLAFIPCEDNLPTDKNFSNVGQNSGNIVFSNSLQTTIKCEPVTTAQLSKRANEFDNLVVRDFVSLRESTDLLYFSNILKYMKDKPIIPISIGVQSADMNPNFTFQPSALRVLEELQERAVLGVRGEYTAYILNKYGIQNIRVIGCPSMYLDANYNRKIQKKDFSEVKKVLSNYRTISNAVDNPIDLAIFDYMSKNTEVFVEQTKLWAGPSVTQNALKPYLNFLVKNRKYFFIFKDWFDFVKDYDFCIGGRFHGNVVPVLAGVPSLFIAIDSRTKELTDFFDFPTILREDFDPSKSLEYYYELADYSEFNKNYPKNLDNFIRFCLDNNLELTSGTQQYFHRKQKGLAKKLEKLESLLHAQEMS